MTSYVYRGVKYMKSNVVSNVDRQATLMYRGTAHVKSDPTPVTLDRSKICYRGFHLAGVTTPGSASPGSLFGFSGHYKLAH